MPGIGTIVNVAAVIAGSLIGLFSGKAIPEKLRDALIKALGVAIMFVGIGCTLGEMLTVDGVGKLSAGGIMLLILSLLIGTVIGELLRIEDRLESFGNRIKSMKVFKNSGSFTEGFVTSTLFISVGAMAVIGSVRDGISGDPSILFSKSVLDFISTMMFASALGVGVVFSALPMGIYQGALTLVACLLGEHFLPETMVSDLSLVGSVLIFCIGINMLLGKKIRVGNMLPALLVPVIYGVFMMILQK